MSCGLRSLPLSPAGCQHLAQHLPGDGAQPWHSPTSCACDPEPESPQATCRPPPPSSRKFPGLCAWESQGGRSVQLPRLHSGASQPASCSPPACTPAGVTWGYWAPLRPGSWELGVHQSERGLLVRPCAAHLPPQLTPPWEVTRLGPPSRSVAGGAQDPGGPVPTPPHTSARPCLDPLPRGACPEPLEQRQVAGHLHPSVCALAQCPLRAAVRGSGGRDPLRWWGCKMVQPRWGAVWQFLGLNVERPRGPAAPLLCVNPEK